MQHWFICRPTDSTMLTDAGIKSRTVATSGALAVRRSNYQARSHFFCVQEAGRSLTAASCCLARQRICPADSTTGSARRARTSHPVFRTLILVTVPVPGQIILKVAVLRNRDRNRRNRNFLPQRNQNRNRDLLRNLGGTGTVINYSSGTGTRTGTAIKWNLTSSHRHSITLCI